MERYVLEKISLVQRLWKYPISYNTLPKCNTSFDSPLRGKNILLEPRPTFLETWTNPLPFLKRSRATGFRFGVKLSVFENRYNMREVERSTSTKAVNSGEGIIHFRRQSIGRGQGLRVYIKSSLGQPSTLPLPQRPPGLFVPFAVPSSLSLSLSFSFPLSFPVSGTPSRDMSEWVVCDVVFPGER